MFPNMHFSLVYFKKSRFPRSISFNQSNDTSIDGMDEQYTKSFELNRIKFFILLALQLLAIPCFLYLFYRYIQKKQLRKNIHYHAIYFLLFISFLFVTMALP